MRLLLTGAFGNVGRAVLRQLADGPHEVTCLDLPTKANRRRADAVPWAVRWVDLTDPRAVASAVEGHDVVLHVAGVIPPASIHRPDVAERVNVGGTRNVIAACQQAPVPPRVVFTSSVALFGPTQHLPPPRSVGDPIVVTDDYTRHKAEAERLLAASGLAVTVLRLGAVIPIEVIGVVDPLMFEVPLEDRIEIVHPDDVGRAVVRAAERPDIVGRTLLIGGGQACRVRQRELMSRALGAVGVGMLPDDAFTTSPFHTDWLDTEDSQSLLDYQRHDLDDLIADMTRSVGWRRAPARLLAPVIRRALVRRSPYPARR